MRVLVTGSAGLIGSHLTDRLLAQGHHVVGVDNFVGGYHDNVADHQHHDFYETDVCDLLIMTSLMSSCDVVYHCAALAYEGLSVFSPVTVVQNIVMGAVTVGTAAVRAGTKRVINFSSAARYGHIGSPYRETATPCPADPYGAAKLAAEKQLELICGTHGVELVHVIPHNVIGPRQKYDDPYRNVVSIMANLLLQGRRPVIYGDGTQRRCFSDVEDLLPVLVTLADCPLEYPVGELFNVGPDEERVMILTLCQKLSHITGHEFDPIHLPARPCEVHLSSCSSDKIRERFGYKTTVSLDQSLRKVVDYIKNRGTREFRYHLDLEIQTKQTPKTWKERMF